MTDDWPWPLREALTTQQSEADNDKNRLPLNWRISCQRGTRKYNQT
jgi:hypothetical protein